MELLTKIEFLEEIIFNNFLKKILVKDDSISFNSEIIIVDTEVSKFFFNSTYDPPSVLKCLKINVPKVKNFWKSELNTERSDCITIIKCG